MFAGDKNSQKLQRGHAHTHFRERQTLSPHMVPPYSLIVNIHSQQFYPPTYSQYFCRIPTLILHPSPQHLLSDSYSTGHTRLGTFTDLLTQILNIHTHICTQIQEICINIHSANTHTYKHIRSKHRNTYTHTHPHTHTLTGRLFFFLYFSFSLFWRSVNVRSLVCPVE